MERRTDNPRSDTNVQAGISVSATYKRQYTLTYLAGTGGAISGAALQVVNAAENGSPVTAVPSEGFVFFQWSDGNTSNPRTDTNVNANITVTAEFLDHFTLTYTAGVNGAIDGTSPQAVSPGADGAPVTAVPNTGYIFSGWSDGNTDNPRTDTNVMANVNVTANFASMPFTLLYTAGPGGVITGTAEQTVQTGGNGSQVRAKPDSGFAFKMWSDGSTVNPRTDTNVTANIDVTAIFVPLYTVRYISGPNGTLLGASPQSIPEGGNSTPVTIVPNPGYAFVKWSDERTDNPRMDTNITAPLSVDAIYKRQFTLTYTAGENGSITGDSPQIVDQGADGTAVTAVPDENFAFLRWSDGVFQNPRTDLNLQADVNAIAIFVDHFTLTYLADPNGSIAGETQQSVLPGADGAPVTAVPNDGHIFLQWSDGSTQNPRTDTGLSTNIIVTAQFVGKPEMIPVAESTFTMGSADFGDDLQHGMDDELPRHEVTLSAYEISKFEVTNQQLCDFLNDYYERGLLRRAAGAPWSGQIEGIYAGATPKRIVAYNLKECNVTFSNGKIIPKTKIGLPGATVYSMGNHPATNITWFGAVLYANWLSEAEGLTPVYEEVLWSANLANDGYHLPTEAQWERAAAWDGTKHWIYSLTADSMNDMSANVRRDRANFEVVTDDFINPIGLVQDGISPYTSPVGWFNGLNISPNGNLQTVDSKSPIGAYDMSGNVIEWCHDRYSATYYSASPALNPDGPPSGISNAARGGAWGRTRNARNVRAAVRFNFAPDFTDGIIGFRIARGGGLEGDVGE
ncbi:MAG: SUMF1/EgtB/PvdO family nonheme iron enzyme [Candidatus Hydrogenedentes bacterium]|nr:SUMF1/EgtB/PvdO family nonheme iron enzyme [Candidatus Hydrogenedentota bacterium]